MHAPDHLVQEGGTARRRSHIFPQHTVGRQEAERRIRELAEVEAGKRTEIEVDAAAADFNRQQETIRRLHEQQLAAKKAEDEEELRRVTAELQNQIAKLREAADLAEAEVKVTVSQDVLRAIARGDGPTPALVALGYAGWSGGQLEAEIAANAWLHAPVSASVLFSTPVENRWRAAAGLLGVDILQVTSYAGHA